LDEIGDIPPATQVKLLRVLEEKEIERVGDHQPLEVDVRIISATNRDLEERVSAGLFREDLFFRINVFPLTMPSLQERMEDIPPLIQGFIQQNNRRSGKKIEGLSPAAMDALLDYEWPGNVRELRNTIEYAFVLCPSGWIDPEHLPHRITRRKPKITKNARTAAPIADPQRETLLEALRRTGGNQSEAARHLGVSRVTVWKRIKKFNVDLNRDL
jgi:transcriptional regulator with PAS, ATPase and Fis domain